MMSLQNDDNPLKDELPEQPDDECTTSERRETSGSQQPPEKQKKRRRKMKTWKKIVLGILCALLAIVLILAAAYAILYFKGRKASLTRKEDVSLSVPDAVKEQVQIDDDGTVSYAQGQYVYNENITNILIMGVDKEKIDKTNGMIGANGQADALYLLSINTKTGEKIVTGISRDSMVDVSEYSETGLYLGTVKEQICLSYAYGDGKKTSCENTVASAQRLLYGIPIQAYAAIDLDTTVTLTELIDGVEVPEYNESFKPTGRTIKLTGGTVNDYIRDRDMVAVDANNNRRERQLNYIKAFASKALSKTKSDLAFPLTLYNAVSDDTVTNVDAGRITYLATVAVQNGGLRYQSVAGEVKMGEQFAEFYVDEDALFQMILSTFYIKK